MCGIAGIVAPDGIIDVRRLQRMNDLLAHRGPDGEGFMLASRTSDGFRCSFHRRVDAGVSGEAIQVGLGHRRLAILDLSERGLQPMRSHDASCWLVFNGEIYNHAALRAALEARGHVFETRTDTEVLVNAYAEWGEACVERLDGMFAFGIWDSAAGRLFCARDRFGIKPFYYATRAGVLAFASEIKALAALPECRLGTDDDAVVGFLAHGNCDYAERTLFRGIRALPAAHTLTFDGRDPHVRRYWTLEARPAHANGDGDTIRQLTESLVSSVRSHLIADVPVGSCLSGGLDSSTLVSIIGALQQREPAATVAVGDRLHTFTSCYEEAAIDERGYALEVADAVGARAQLVFPSAEDFWSELPRIAWHQDMPFGSFSFYAQWRVMRAARESGVKVLIDGQGGDEVFGGYAKFRYAHLMSLLKAGQVRSFAGELAGMYRQRDPYIFDIRSGYRYLPAPVRRALNVDSALQEVVGAGWQRAVGDESTPATRWWRYASEGTGNGNGHAQGWTFMQRMQIDDITVDTLPQLLRMEDRSSMAFSLEARVPLLDHRLVEFAVSMPDRLKVRRGYSKYAVREAMTGIVPERVRQRTTKLGFAAPDRRWLAEDLREPVADLLQSELRCRRFVDVQALRRWHQSPHARRANAASLLGLFRVVSLEAWMRAFDLS